jgi:hypothetical protein
VLAVDAARFVLAYYFHPPIGQDSRTLGHTDMHLAHVVVNDGSFDPSSVSLFVLKFISYNLPLQTIARDTHSKSIYSFDIYFRVENKSECSGLDPIDSFHLSEYKY